MQYLYDFDTILYDVVENSVIMDSEAECGVLLTTQPLDRTLAGSFRLGLEMPFNGIHNGNSIVALHSLKLATCLGLKYYSKPLVSG